MTKEEKYKNEINKLKSKINHLNSVMKILNERPKTICSQFVDIPEGAEKCSFSLTNGIAYVMFYGYINNGGFEPASDTYWKIPVSFE